MPGEHASVPFHFNITLAGARCKKCGYTDVRYRLARPWSPLPQCPNCKSTEWIRLSGEELYPFVRSALASCER